MNYPVWELGMGGGVLIAVVSILHVFVSHFAVGGGLWLVVTEMRANRTGDAALRAFVKSHSRVFMLLTLVFGAISGVGIWATIGLVSPHGTSALIHGFVWGWAMEWVFFLLEIAAAMVYYYGWDKLDPGTHELMGWVYFVAAFISLIIINGIITFMLTPGGWLQDHRILDRLLQPHLLAFGGDPHLRRYRDRRHVHLAYGGRPGARRFPPARDAMERRLGVPFDARGDRVGRGTDRRSGRGTRTRPCSGPFRSCRRWPVTSRSA